MGRGAGMGQGSAAELTDEVLQRIYYRDAAADDANGDNRGRDDI